MASVLFLGESTPGTTSVHRARAIARLGYTVIIKDPYQEYSRLLGFSWLGKLLGFSWLGAVHYRTGYRFFQPQIKKWTKILLDSMDKPDIIWVDHGELFGRKCIQLFKKFKCPIVLYNVDDPTGKRDGRRFDSLINALPLYDLVTVVRKESEIECRNLGAKRTLRVFRSYDEVDHKPYADINDIPAIYKSEVAFIGTWMRHEKRDEFLMELIKQGVPISIWGVRWSKSPHWDFLKDYYRGDSLTGRNYVAAIQGSKICLGLLSKGNRDLHTTRSLEVPFAGGLLCAERTIEHQEMYVEGKEAVFWSDARECADVCKKLLQDDAKREKIRLAGMAKVRLLKVGNEDICGTVLDVLGKNVYETDLPKSTSVPAFSVHEEEG